MSYQEVQTEPDAKRRRTLTSMLLRGAGFLFCAVLTVLFGLIPFLLGVVAQALSPRRIPPYGVGPLAAATFFALWHFTGWLPITIGDGSIVWASVFLSLMLFVAFFGSGAAILRELLPRRFATVPASPTPQ